MSSKVVSQLDADGYFLWPTLADESPLEPGVFLPPGGCVDVEPPEVPDGKRARFVDGSFLLEDIPVPPPPPTLPPPSPEDVAANISRVVQERLDAFAREREYDDIKSLVTYAGDTDPTLNAEGTLGKQLRSQTWVKMKQIQMEVLAGLRPMPVSIADIEAELPPLVWPK